MPTVENANALTFWMYSEKELHLYATVTTGVSANNTWVCKTSKPIALSVGWNFVTLDVRYSFDALGLDFNNGLQELYFRTGDANAVGKTPATLYIDSVYFANLEIPDGLYFVFDSKPEATGTIGGTAVATAPRMLVEEGVTLTVAVTAPNGEQTIVNAGDSFDLTLGGYYTLTYKAEKEGKPTQEVSFQVLATDPAEFLSFETINGATPDIGKGVYGNVTANTDSRYVKVGKQSAKLETVLNDWGNCTAGFAWDGGALQMPTVENANALTFWMYSEKELHLYATVTTGVSANNTWVCKTSKPIALSVGWNFVTLDVRYSFDALGLDFNNGLQELYFRNG